MARSLNKVVTLVTEDVTYNIGEKGGTCHNVTMSQSNAAPISPRGTLSPYIHCDFLVHLRYLKKYKIE